MVLTMFIIIGGIFLIVFNLWYKSKLAKYTQKLSETPDEVKVKDEDVANLKKMLYINAVIAIITVALTIIKLIDVFKG